MIIPAKESKVYRVDSSSSDPHLAGPLEVKLTASGVLIRWAGEQQWKSIDWYEIAILAEAPGEYARVIDQWQVEAFEEGLRDGVKTAASEVAVVDYAEELRERREAEARRAENNPAFAG